MVERIGGEGDDTLDGGVYDDVIVGLGGNDLLRGWAGNDLLVDTEGLTCSIDGGLGADTISIGHSHFIGAIEGGLGYDTLRVGNADLTGIALSGLETLAVSGTVVARAEQFRSFLWIINFEGEVWGTVRLRLAEGGSGALNLMGLLSSGGGTRSAIMEGSSGDDQVTLGVGADTFWGQAGQDWVIGAGGADVIEGGTGNDTLEGWAGEDTLYGGEGEDVLMGHADNDTLIDTEGGSVMMYGGMGEDILQISGAAFASGILNGGSETDRLRVTGDITALTIQEVEILEVTLGVTARAAQFDAFSTITWQDDPLRRVTLALAPSGGAPSAGTVTLDLGDELGLRGVVLTATAEAERLTTGGGADRIDAGAGADVVFGGAGADEIWGGAGDDQLYGGEEADTLIGGAGADRLDGGAGDDLLRDDAPAGGALYGGAGADRFEIYGTGVVTLDGGEGRDMLVNLSETSGMDLTAMTLAGIEVLETRGQAVRLGVAQLAGMETITASAGTVTLWFAGGGVFDLSTRLGAAGRVWNSVLLGGAAEETITGGAGRDTIAGGNGDDLLSGGLGRNSLSGGNGNNTVTYAAMTGGVWVSLAQGLARFVGGADTLAGLRNVIGSEGADTIIGHGAGNLLRGGLGADSLSGLAGADTLDGGAGEDTMDGGAGADVFLLRPGEGGDLIRGFGLEDRLDLSTVDLFFSELLLSDEAAGLRFALPEGSFFFLEGWRAADLRSDVFVFGTRTGRVFEGGLGADAIDALGASGFSGPFEALADAVGDVFHGGGGADTIHAGAGEDLIEGGEGDDLLDGGLGRDTLYGGAGDDRLIWDGLDLYDGGEGRDCLDGSALVARIGLTLGQGIEEMIGGFGADSLTGTAEDNRLWGGAGDDVLTGGAGNDGLWGGAGANLLYGGEGEDLLDGALGDSLYGGAGNDRLVWAGGAGRVDGGSESDTLAASGDISGLAVVGVEVLEIVAPITMGSSQLAGYASVTGVLDITVTGVINLTGKVAGGARLTGMATADTLMGGAFADEIYGGEGADRLIGGSGNDTIVGGGGVDTLLGWDGDDVFEAGEGDSIEGGDGADRILWAGGSGVISGGPGSDAVIAGGDLRGVSLTSVEALEALAPLRLLASQITGFGSLRGAIDVTVSGRGDLTGRVSGAVTLRGESGADTLIGASGDDLILGGDGADSLTGAAGADTLVGGAGVDVLVGGAGADVFVFAGDLGVGEDRITDFATGDRIDLSGLSGGVSHGEWLSTAGADLRIDLGGGASVLVLQATAASVLAGILW